RGWRPLRVSALLWLFCFVGITETTLSITRRETPPSMFSALSYKSPKSVDGSKGLISPCGVLVPSTKYILYPVYVRTRKSFGLMTRKLSVTESRKRFQFLGTLSRKKSSVASANCPHVAYHLLCVTFLCMTPHNRWIGFKCGK